jgi:hypothetical protein
MSIESLQRIKRWQVALILDVAALVGQAAGQGKSTGAAAGAVAA